MADKSSPYNHKAPPPESGSDKRVVGPKWVQPEIGVIFFIMQNVAFTAYKNGKLMTKSFTPRVLLLVVGGRERGLGAEVESK